MLHPYRNLIIFTLALTVAVGCRPSTGAEKAAAPAGGKGIVGSVLPAFQVKTLDTNESVSLDQYRGKIVILNLFASWCPPCRMEIPDFIELQKKHADRLSVVGLSYDRGAAADLKRFLNEMGVNYNVYWGSEEIAQYVGLRGIPHTLVLDPEGRVVRSYIGYTSSGKFEQDILALNRDVPAPPGTQP